MYTNSCSIAILLAAYNAENFIGEQLDSIFRQTNQDWILYIRNDGSQDKTQEIIERYNENYPGKIVLVDKGGKNLGCRGNFFRLLEVVDSEYYVFSDADDIWLDDKVQVSLDAIKEAEAQHPGAPVMAFGDTIVCDSKMNIIEQSYWKSMNINPENFLSYNYMAVCCTAGGSCSIFNQQVKDVLFPLVNNGLIYDFWIALVVAKTGYFKVIHRPLKYYRQHADQVYGVSYGKQNTVRYKLKNISNLIKQYRWEAQHHADFGYGPPIKYYWYKLLTILKIRFGKYR